MSTLTDKIAAEHSPSRWRSFANEVEIIRCCGTDFGPHPTRKPKADDHGKATRDFVAHVAEVTERAVRAQIAANIRAWAAEQEDGVLTSGPYSSGVRYAISACEGIAEGSAD